MLGCDLEERKYILEGTKNAKLAAWWDRAIDIIPYQYHFLHLQTLWLLPLRIYNVQEPVQSQFLFHLLLE